MTPSEIFQYGCLGANICFIVVAGYVLYQQKRKNKMLKENK